MKRGIICIGVHINECLNHNKGNTMSPKIVIGIPFYDLAIILLNIYSKKMKTMYRRDDYESICVYYSISNKSQHKDRISLKFHQGMNG